MTISDLGDLGDFLGGIGVIITLIYLAIQIRRNTTTVRTASLDSAYTSHMEFQRTVWSDPDLNKLWFAGLLGEEPLVATDGRRFFFMLISCARVWENAYIKAQEGSLETKAWAGLNQELLDVFSAPGVQPYWGEVFTRYSHEFVTFAESAVRDRIAAGGVDD